MLAANRGTQFIIKAEGSDEAEAVEILSNLVESALMR